MLNRFRAYSKYPQDVLGKVACVLLVCPISFLVNWFYLLHLLDHCVTSAHGSVHTKGYWCSDL